MSVLLVALGLLTVVVAVLDVIWTAAAAGSGAGPLSGRLSAILWRGALAAGRTADGPRHRFLTLAGISVVVVVVLAWAAFAWAGWWIVFSASDGAVVDAATGAPAGLVERAQFAGANFFTLGGDELTAGSGAWQFAPIGATATGVVFVTLAISYFVPVASALAERRQLGAYISSLGDTPEDLVVRGWTNDSFHGLEQHLVALTPLVHSLAERHLTYPVLQYFHSGRRERTSTALTLVVLDEALSLLRSGVAADARPDPAVLRPLDRALEWYLDTVQGSFVTDAPAPIDPPDLSALRQGGVPTVADDEWLAAVRSGHRGGASWPPSWSTRDGSRRHGNDAGRPSGRERSDPVRRRHDVAASGFATVPGRHPAVRRTTVTQPNEEETDGVEPERDHARVGGLQATGRLLHQGPG